MYFYVNKCFLLLGFEKKIKGQIQSGFCKRGFKVLLLTELWVSVKKVASDCFECALVYGFQGRQKLPQVLSAIGREEKAKVECCFVLVLCCSWTMHDKACNFESAIGYSIQFNFRIYGGSYN